MSEVAQQAEEFERLAAAVRAFHAASLEAERSGVNVSLIARLSAAEREVARLSEECLELQQAVQALLESRPRRGLRVVGGTA